MDKKHLYWSFQSSQTLEPTEKQLELFQRKYKADYEQRTVYEGQELLDKYRLNGWRNSLFSSVTSIILAFEHEGTLRVKFIEGAEKDIITEAYSQGRIDEETRFPYATDGEDYYKTEFCS
jgi:hypothetical protein